ncbi:BTB/POZ domain-containing protein KCTD21-like [Branchiostoma lanceolatum]|uniref:BTB/POZ domain-containing protein KCTD21-like n=1 Tax=Branchiostoma lanceolatum TaxID=7740 RepID=UPI003451282E
MSRYDSIVNLNVGGHFYTTARSTLTRYPDSMLGAMFGEDFEFDTMQSVQDDQGRYFIDRNGRLFEHVLNFLRTHQLVLPEDFKELPLLEIEADFYQIQPLIEALRSYKAPFETSPAYACEVVFLSRTLVGFPHQDRGGSLMVSASSKEVEDMVHGFGMGRLVTEGHMAVLLGRLQDRGFTVQSHATSVVANVHGGNNNVENKWVLVRKTVRSSSASKASVGDQ